MPATATGGTGDLAGTEWVWTETLMSDDTKIAPVQADVFTLIFNPDGTINAATDCNAFSGSYTVNGSKISIELPISTRMACPEDAQQDAYIKNLTSVQSFVMADGDLVLAMPVDAGTIHYAPVKAATAGVQGAADPGTLAGTEWIWTQTLMNDGTKITPEQADAFHVIFFADSGMSATTDCNTFTGTYTVGDDGAIKIDLPVSTRKGCPDGVQEGDYIKALTSVQFYLMQDGNLHLMSTRRCLTSGTIELYDRDPSVLIGASLDVRIRIGFIHSPDIALVEFWKAEEQKMATEAKQPVNGKSENGAVTGTFAVKAGLAQMLKGGVIMDVVTAEQARIAEEAGACAVMALERVPADIRKDGGVARMSDPTVIRAHHGRRHHPGHGQGAHRPLCRGANPAVAGHRLH